MIPRTFPSSVASNGSRQMIVYFLPSVSGLTRWVDYIPVKFTTVATAATENTYNQNGYIPVVSLSSIAGATPFKEYVPVFLDSSAADADVWDVTITGFIPVGTAGIGGAALYLDFAATTTLDPRVTFSRTSNATVTNSAGLVANAPMNLLTYSEQFDNAAWAKGASTITANAATAPNGTTTADAVIADTTTTYHDTRQAFTGASGANYTVSVYVKANGYTKFYFADANSGRFAVAFDLIAVSVTATSGAGYVSSAITSVGGGWYRCVATYSSTGALVSHTMIGYPDAGATLNNFGAQYTGNGTSGIYLWGAQLELGSTATTYNPTTVKNLLGYTEHFDNAAWTKSNAFVQTNLVLQSQDFDTASWTKIGATVSANTTAAPDGTTTADKLSEDASTGVHVVTQNPALTTGVVQAVSVYAKAAERSWLLVTFANDSNLGAWFNLSNGTVGTRQANNASASIVSTGDGWYRCTITFSPTKTNPYLAFYMGTADNTPNYTGVVGNGLFIWGAQLVQGTSAGNYQATYAAAAAVGYTDIYGQPFAQKLVESTANSTHQVFPNAAVTLGTGVAYTYSIYAKAAERTICRLTNNDLIGVFFDLAAGVVTDVAAGFTGSIENMGNGWYRLGAVQASNSNVSGRLAIGLVSTGTTASYTGDGTSGIYIFGAQLSDSASVDPYVYRPVTAPTSTAYYGPRFDYDPVTLAPKGLLIEEQRTNLVLNSSILNTQIITVTAAAHTLSFYGTGTIVLSGAYTGTVAGTGAYPTRTTLTFTPIIGALTLTVTGSVTMAQLEAGAFATSYIPTAASQVTRAADNVSMIGNNFARWYNVNTGSLFTQFQLISGNGAGNNSNIAAFEGAAGVNMTLHRDSAAGWRYRTNLANQNVTGVSDTASNKTVFAYATSDYPFDVAGGAVQLNTGVGAPPVTTSFLIGGGSNYALAKPINGTIARIAYYNRRLANSELQSITA